MGRAITLRHLGLFPLDDHEVMLIQSLVQETPVFANICNAQIVSVGFYTSMM